MSFILRVSIIKRVSVSWWACIKRDEQDFLYIREKLEDFSPFLEENTLQNICNGVIAYENVNIDTFFEIGSSLMDQINISYPLIRTRTWVC